MFTYMTKTTVDAERDGPMATHWEAGSGVDRLNTEAAVALRAVVGPIIRSAGDWREMQKKLAQKGFGLAFRKGHMVLTDIATGMAICTGQFLGTPLKDLSARLGRPQIVALPGGMAGDFLH